MQAEAYRLMAELEDEHWWYRGRRAVLARLLARLEPPAGARLLEVGAGTGGNLELLTGFGAAFGVEPARACTPLGLDRWRGRVARATGEALPFRDRTFDVVAALDVLEHVHDDLAALDEMRRVLRPGGIVLLHVPAYAWLWGHEDVVSEHLRRYRAAEVRRLLVAAGFEVLHAGYTTALLLPAIAAVKIGKRLLLPAAEPRPDVARLPPEPWNGLLAALLEIEAEVTATAEVPCGASVIAAGRAPG